eukprot:3252172-Pleurochrysis_carterae.AAC.1
MRARAARHSRYSGDVSAARNGASAASMSCRNRCRMASLKRCAILDAGCVPDPSLRSETKKRVLPAASRCCGCVRRTSSSLMNTILSFYHSSGVETQTLHFIFPFPSSYLFYTSPPALFSSFGYVPRSNPGTFKRLRSLRTYVPTYSRLFCRHRTDYI